MFACICMWVWPTQYTLCQEYLSCPAVSHISNLIVVESCKAIVCDKKEAPIVTWKSKVTNLNWCIKSSSSLLGPVGAGVGLGAGERGMEGGGGGGEA